MPLAVVFAIIGSLAICPASANPLEAASSPSAVAAASDPIARLLDRLSGSRALWHNGLFPSLGLPGSAPNEQVLSRVLEHSAFDKGPVSEHLILESRQVRMPGDLEGIYTALLVDTNLGRKIVILKFHGPAVGWWSRIYDADAA